MIPRLAVAEPAQCVAFLQDVFGARGVYRADRPAEMRIGDGLVMVGSIVERLATTSFLYVYVADTDQAFEKALARGAIPIERPQEMPYGDRRAMVEDPWGNRWQIATHRAFKGEGAAQGSGDTPNNAACKP